MSDDDDENDEAYSDLSGFSDEGDDDYLLALGGGGEERGSDVNLLKAREGGVLEADNNENHDNDVDEEDDDDQEGEGDDYNYDDDENNVGGEDALLETGSNVHSGGRGLDGKVVIAELSLDEISYDRDISRVNVASSYRSNGLLLVRPGGRSSNVKYSASNPNPGLGAPVLSTEKRLVEFNDVPTDYKFKKDRRRREHRENREGGGRGGAGGSGVSNSISILVGRGRPSLAGEEKHPPNQTSLNPNPNRAERPDRRERRAERRRNRNQEGGDTPVETVGVDIVGSIGGAADRGGEQAPRPGGGGGGAGAEFIARRSRTRGHGQAGAQG